jgi:ribose/xylose/arabinose/galactoside ABC-type transport system permease subunit
MMSIRPLSSNHASRIQALGSLAGKLGPALGLIAVWLIFAALEGRDFVSWSNQRLMLLQTAVVAIAAVGATFVIVSGGIDLSVGSAIAFGTMILALALKQGMSPGPAILLTLIVGFLLGVVIGTMVVGRIGRVLAIGTAAAIGMFAYRWTPMIVAIPLALLSALPLLWLADRLLGVVRLSPFIVTLGMWGALRGAAKGLGDNQPIYPDQTWLTDLMQPAREGVFAILAPGVWLVLLLALLMSLILRYTRFGKHVYAIGSNELTAHLCGVPVARNKLLIYGLASTCAALAAILQFAFLFGQGDPTTAEGYELKVIASVVIGGASLLGGEGTIAGTLVGALIMTIVDNGCTKLGLDNWVQEIVTGAIILAAVTLDQWRHRRSTEQAV